MPEHSSGSRPPALRRDWAPHVRPRLSALRLSPAREHEIVEELSQHLEDRWRELVAGGTPEDEATRLALAEFREGNLLARYMAPLKQAQMPAVITPGASAGHGLRGVWQDLRYAMRMFGRQPTFSLTAILTLALGIGATTAMFSVVNGVVIKPLPYPESENVMTVGVSAVFGTQRTPGFPLAPRMFASYAADGRSFQEFGLFTGAEVTVTGSGNPERTDALQVTRGILTTLGVQPALGRWFSLDDHRPGTEDTVILSHGYWQRRFGGDREVIGRVLTIDARPRAVIGVMPASFSIREIAADLILPLRFDPVHLEPGLLPPGFCCRGIARLKPGATPAQANADVARMVEAWKRVENRPQLEDLQLGPAVRALKDDVVGDVGRVLWVLLGSISILLVIACANVANLLLVRAEGRGQELALRTALGAGWRQLARLLMVESLLLGLLGGVIGLGLAYGGLRVLVALAPANLPRLNEITIDGAVLGFAVAASIASGLLFGLIPIARIVKSKSPLSLAESVRSGGGRSASTGRNQHRSQNTLVVVQVALALVLLISSGLMIRTFQNLRNVQPGFTDPATIQSVRIALSAVDVPEPERVTRVQQEVLDRLATIPGVTSAAFIDALPMEQNRLNAIVAAEGQDYGPKGIPPTRTIKMISPGALQTLGTALLAGRDFTWEEIHNQRNVAMVSESFARGEWSTVEGAIGKRVLVGTSQTWQEVIGVVADVYDAGADQPVPLMIYWPARLQDFVAGPLLRRSVNFVLRSERTGTEPFVQEIRHAVTEVMPNLPVFQVRTLREVYDQSMAPTAFSLVLLGIAGAMALLLGIVGIYGVLAYAVMQRQREVGIRLALGARPGSVTRMFVYRGMMLSGIGIASGVAVAAAITRWMSALLFGVTPVDAATFAAAASALVLATLAASYFPARRAAAVDPVHTLTAQ
ncbi:MAG TPA: ABC transporter permease [Vicinamibacterales bacterium]|nr:ABC transporter permease [Vicinamibacterales bacterium]